MADHVDELLPGYAAGTLPEDEQLIVEAHLAGCAPCLASSREWRQVARAVQLDVATRADPLPGLSPVLERIALLPPNGAGNGLDERPAASPDAAGSAPNGRKRRSAPWLLLLLALVPAVLWLLSPDLPKGDRGRHAGTARARLTGLAPTDAMPPNGLARDANAAPGTSGAEAATAVARRGPPAQVSAVVSGRPAAPEAAPVVPPAVRATAVPGANGPVLDSGAPVPAAPATGVPQSAVVPDVATPEGRPAAIPAVPTVLAPAPARTGTIAGRVLGPDGAGRAEIRVRADPAGPGTPVEAYTEPDGRYVLAVAPGEWVVHAEAPAYQLEWFGGQATPFGAPALDVAAGDRVDGVDFALRPYAGGRVSGRVTMADGTGVPRALIVAVQSFARGASNGDGDGGYRAAAFTGVDGTYTLYLLPGEYAVGVTADWRQAPGTWWRSAKDLARADPVQAGENGAEAVDLVLR